MSVTRREVLEELAAASSATVKEGTTVAALADALDTDRRTIETHLDGLTRCELALRYPDESVRVTITGEQLLELDTDDVVIVDASETTGTVEPE